MSKGHKWNNPERGVKTWLCRRFSLQYKAGGQWPDDEICAWIITQTGWEKPMRKARRAFMLKYWVERVQSLPKAAPVNASKPAKVGNFYLTRAWRAVRYKALVLHGAACQCCGVTAASGTLMHVDHIKPRSKFPELELELSNLQVLCEDCNLGKGAGDQTDWRPTQEIAEEAAEHMRSMLN